MNYCRSPFSDNLKCLFSKIKKKQIKEKEYEAQDKIKSENYEKEKKRLNYIKEIKQKELDNTLEILKKERDSEALQDELEIKEL